MLACAPALAQVAPPPDLCNLETPERIVAVGDVHGAYEPFAAILREAELIDRRGRWIGGRAVLVQTGDVLDRGPDSRRTIDLLRRLEREASHAGGAVYALLGNHELMRLSGDWRYVSSGEYRAFRVRWSVALREAAMERAERNAVEQARREGRQIDVLALRAELDRQTPLGLAELASAFGAEGNYGRWIRDRPAVIKINGVVFVHGGITPAVAERGCAAIDRTVAAELATLTQDASAAPGLGSHEEGPLWYRGLVTEPEDAFEPALAMILERMDARAIVVGHTTTPGRIMARFGGRVLAIDTGMLAGDFYPQGAPAALELVGDTATALYVGGRREELPALAPRAEPKR
jgi:hypothetical protein